MSTNPFEGAPIIHTYTRAQAIEDGVLVDLSQAEFGQLFKEAGIRFPVACTRAVYEDCINLTTAARRALNDVTGRTWDLAWMLSTAIRLKGESTDTLLFPLRVVIKRRTPSKVTLKAVCGPDDEGRPCITVMYPHED
jgi:hypothetical protein